MKWKMLAMCLLFMAVLIPMSVQAEYVVTPTGNSAILRKMPTTDAEICGSLENGTEVSVVEVNGAWSKVDTGSDVAWLQSKYLSDEPTTVDLSGLMGREPDSIMEVDYTSFRLVDPYYTYVQALVSGSFINLRWAPSRAAAVQHRMNDGAAVIVIAEGDEWSQIMDDATGYIGFVQNVFLAPETAAIEP